MNNIIMIQYNNCGQSFAKDCGTYDITSTDLIQSAVRCNQADSIEDVDMDRIDNLVYCNLNQVNKFILVQEYNENHYSLSTFNNESLFYIGPVKHYPAVIGSIMAVVNDRGNLIKEI